MGEPLDYEPKAPRYKATMMQVRPWLGAIALALVAMMLIAGLRRTPAPGVTRIPGPAVRLNNQGPPPGTATSRPVNSP